MPAAKDTIDETVTHIPTSGKPHRYDIPILEKFLDVVFHDVHEPDGQGLLWTANPGGAPGFPKGEIDTINLLKRATAAKSLYVGTSVCRKGADGRLYNRKSQFGALVLVVLDDVGTKVPLSRLSKKLREMATYVIETSPGNFQYGFVLQVAVRDLVLARSLISIIYSSGCTDAGGAQPTKLVRLPEGVNGKAAHKDFRVTLTEWRPESLWTPQELLTEVGSDVLWTDLEKDAEGVMRSRRAAPASRWSELGASSPTAEGVIDPVFEWLIDSDRVYTETDEWVTIKCPWSGEHTTGDDTAGYSPVGRGPDEYIDRRSFWCFHEHCKDKTSGDFLTWVAEEGGPEAALTDAAAQLLAQWVYDGTNDAALRLSDGKAIKFAAFRNLYPRKVNVFTYDGKVKQVPEVVMWLNSPQRITVMNTACNVTTEARLFYDNDGELTLNTFKPPPWGRGPIDKIHIETFLSFIRYLIPDETEREGWMTWLTAKAQDMSFRGPGILMVAETQGTGRTTLADMLRTLFGMSNFSNIPFDRVTSPGDFNEWMESPIVQSDETLHTTTASTYKAYEALKEVVDFRPKEVRINAKYQHPRKVVTYTSLLMFSNHEFALGVSAHDRRLYVISNPRTAAPPAYFDALNAWLAETDTTGRPAWAASVWRWLQERTVDVTELYKPAAVTDAKRTMLERSNGTVGQAVDMVLSMWPGRVVWYNAVKDVVMSQADKLLIDPAKIPTLIRHRLNEHSVNVHRNFKITTPGYGQFRPKVITPVTDDEAADWLTEVVTVAARAEVCVEAARVDVSKLKREFAGKIRELEI